MNKFHTLLLLTTLVPTISYAQQNFKPGYIVNLKGDTLKGQIDYREWNNTPTTIRFRASASAQPDDFSVDNTRGFAVNGFETYRAFTVPVSTHSISITNPLSEMDTVKHPKKVFLKQLVNGDRVNLYGYTDEVKSRYYYAETGSEPVELDYWVYSSGGILLNRRYRNQLSYLAQKYQPQVARDASQAEYDELIITKIVQQMNNRITTKAVLDGGKAVDLYIGAGINYSTLKFDGSFPLTTGVSNSVTPLPYLNVGVNCYANPGIRKLYFAVDLTLKASSQKTTGHFGVNYGDLDYKQYTVTVSPQVGYNFYNTIALKVFGNIGLGLNYSGYKVNYVNRSDITSFVTTSTTYPEFEHLWINAMVKAGITLKQKLSIYAAYVPPSTITNYSTFSARVSVYQVGVNLMIGK